MTKIIGSLEFMYNPAIFRFFNRQGLIMNIER